MSRKVASAIGTNVLLRLASFALSIFLTRVSLPEMRGAAFQAEMVVNTAGFLAREAIRCLYASQSSTIHQRNGAARLLCLACLAVPLGLAVLAALEVLQLVMPLPALSSLVVFSSPISAALFVAGLLVEWLAEPLVALCVATHSFSLRVAAEAIALVASKAVALAALVALGDASTHQVLAMQQLTFGAIFAAILASGIFFARSPAAAKSDIPSLAVARAAAVEAVGGGLVTPVGVGREARRRASAWWAYFSENVLRLVLTEGEKYILTAFASVASQGIYDVVSNLGSLVARLVFRVWEDAMFNTWKARIAKDASPRDCLASLGDMLRVCLYCGMLSISVAGPLPRVALTVLFTERWASDEATNVLRGFCAYLPLLGVNGLLEAFIRATAPPPAFERARNMMVAVSALSIANTLFWVRYLQFGVVGIIASAVVNMLVRVAVNALTIHSFSQMPLTTVAYRWRWLALTTTALPALFTLLFAVVLPPVPQNVSLVSMVQSVSYVVLVLLPVSALFYLFELRSSTKKQQD